MDQPIDTRVRTLLLWSGAGAAWSIALAVGIAGLVQASVARSEVHRLAAIVSIPQSASAREAPAREREAPAREREEEWTRARTPFGEGAALDDRSRADVELLIASLRREGLSALRRFPRASTAEIAGDPVRVRGKIVPIAGTLGEVRYGNGFAAGRMTAHDGRDVYFATPLRLEGLAIGAPCIFEGLAVSVRWPSDGRVEELVVGAFTPNAL